MWRKRSSWGIGGTDQLNDVIHEPANLVMPELVWKHNLWGAEPSEHDAMHYLVLEKSNILRLLHRWIEHSYLYPLRKVYNDYINSLSMIIISLNYYNTTLIIHSNNKIIDYLIILLFVNSYSILVFHHFNQIISLLSQ